MMNTIHWKAIFLFIYLWWSPSFTWSQSNAIHPRGIINPQEMVVLREKVKRRPYRAMYQNLFDVASRQMKEQRERPYDPYADSRLLANQSFLFILSGDTVWADGAWKTAERILSDSVYFNDPLSRGLTRATLLQKMALAYDFCYPAWNEAQRQRVNRQLFEVMFSVNANMGHSANYAIESNWMGVRYGSVILASYVWDEPSLQQTHQSPQLPIRWDAIKRLQDHLEASIFSNGWNGESMSYHIYGWTFIGPALLALKNNISAFELADFAPETINTLHGIMSSTVAIQQRGAKGIQADLSDDDLLFNTAGVLGMAFRLYPEEQQPALKWMHDYLINSQEYVTNEDGHHEDGHLFYSILYYPEALKAENPEKVGWLTYHDPEQGIVIIRNRFQDEEDIVSTYNAKQTRIKGHAGPDANTFRLIGLGVPWIIGGGRTAQTAGQTNLFPTHENTPAQDTKGLGKLHEYHFSDDRSEAFAIGSGSSVGTEGHQRIFYSSFSEETNAAAAIIVKDVSLNGRRWRINTPEFNEFRKIEKGYQLISPDGASMRVQFLLPATDLEIESGLLRYGGKTENHNPGIWYKNKFYSFSRYIDVFCEANVTAVITLQPAGKIHPSVSLKSDGSFLVGDRNIHLPETHVLKKK
ncbi:hypothetical protein WJR50_29615 [Catalinimonas sp. 4WD22]|uniref:hypothetical protein n=1 Tax=Catalinimonas locisalis TaxID=3133978 RepID=UPI003100D086